MSTGHTTNHEKLGGKQMHKKLQFVSFCNLRYHSPIQSTLDILVTTDPYLSPITNY